MPKLIYLANARLPTEKAHGLQIVQMCEAFSQAGYDVTLVVPDRRSQPRHQGKDAHAFYGVAPVFEVIRLWTLEQASQRGITRWIYRLQAVTFFASVLVWLARQPHAAILYSRDQFLLWLVGLWYPRRKTVFEAHTASQTRAGRMIQRAVVRRAALALAVTRHLAEELEALAGRPVKVEHDGIRAERFAGMPDQREARNRLKLPPGGFIACYVGQLATLRMDKGLGTVIEAFARCEALRPGWGGHLLIVGGPDAAVEGLRQDWAKLGLPPESFHAAGQVLAGEVPGFLAASDVCLMPQPWTQFFAYFTSPLKLFEYMASGRPILASDLPSFREVLAEGENALFFPPSDPEALAAALLRLSEDPALRQRMGERNRRDVATYTWQARADRIRAALAEERGGRA